MMIQLLLSPNLRTSNMKLADLLQQTVARFGSLFLDFPREMSGLINDLAVENISYDELLDEVRRSRLIPEPVASFEYAAKPVLSALTKIRSINPGLEIVCYGSSENEFASMNNAVELARLTLRTSMTGRVDVKDWRRILVLSLDLGYKAFEEEASVLRDNIDEDSICVSDMGGRGLKKPLTIAGYDVRIRYVEVPYHFTPLMILLRVMRRRAVSGEEIEEQVRNHVDYVRSYIYRYESRDRAYYEWAYENVPWIRSRISKEEIERLDSIILNT